MVLDNLALNNLENQCKQLKPGTEYVIQMTQQKLDEHLRKTIQKTGCDIKLKNGKIIIVKKQEEEDPLAGWGDMSDINTFKRQVHKEAKQAKNRAEQAQNKLKKDINDEKKTHKQAEQAQNRAKQAENRAEQAENRAEQAENRAEQAQKEAELAKKQLALASYKDEIATNLNNLLDFNRPKEKVGDTLNKILLDANNLKQGDFYKTTQDEINLRIGTLKQIKLHYKSDNKITEKADKIIAVFNKFSS